MSSKTAMGNHIQSQAEWESEIAGKIFRQVHNEVYLELRFLDTALAALTPREQTDLHCFATEGTFLYFSPSHLISIYEKNPRFLSRAWLHTILHCVFSHLWLRDGRTRNLWDLACDIAVERLIDGMGKKCTRRPVTWLRQKTYEELSRQGRISAAGIYSWLCGQEESLHRELVKEFFTDSHKYWPDEERSLPQNPQIRETWDRISRQSRMEMERQGREPEEGEGALLQQLRTQRSRRSYREFLRKFAVLKEEMHCDPDEFDIGTYSFGLRHYGNMPLIEPLEVREVMKIQEFVIVVDTSYSTNGTLVKNFLRETFTLLTMSGRFLRKCHVRILQCDDQVRADKQVTTAAELETLLEQFTVIGGGGTNFCPAFDYVNELRERGELRNLQGLIYFTDGKGIYPSSRPDYDTAFLFLEDYEEEAVPPWAMKLRLEVHEFEA